MRDIIAKHAAGAMSGYSASVRCYVFRPRARQTGAYTAVACARSEQARSGEESRLEMAGYVHTGEQVLITDKGRGNPIPNVGGDGHAPRDV